MNYIILIPVYNGFKESLDCLNSVIKNTSKDIPIVIIDDASPSGEFYSFAKGKFDGSANVIFKRAKENGGYVKASNFGLKNAEHILNIESYEVSYKDDYGVSPKFDVILLNSDTLVTACWDESLKKAAYSSDKIASVTPYSNNAILASFPRFCRENRPDIAKIESTAQKIQKNSSPSYPKLPTAMGFCNYIRRDALSVIGYYDEINFGRGNGEENDFSLRARALGYSCILDDASYVYHIGEVSFAETKRDLENKNGEKIRKMYPHYMDEISKYCSSDPNRENRNNLLDKIFVNEEEKPLVLHLVHNTVNYSKYFTTLGGTEIHTFSLIRELKDYNHAALVLYKSYYHLTLFFENLEREFYLPRDSYSLDEIVNSGFFSLIHLQHSANFDRSELTKVITKHGNYVTSLHDFNLQCPRNILITPDKKLCNKLECTSTCGYSDEFINSFRSNGLKILNNSNKILAFSNSTVSTVEEISKKRIANFEIIKHASIQSDKKIEAKKVNSSLDILLLGMLVDHKGLKIIKDLISFNSGLKLKFHLLGKMESEFSHDNFVNHGPYSKETISDKILNINPHIVFIPAVCEETFSLTLDEALAFGVPALVGPNGAPKERVLEQNVGWVLDSLEIDLIVNTIEKISNDYGDYIEKYNNAKNYKALSKEEEGHLYKKIYDTLTTKEPKSINHKTLIDYFSKHSDLYEIEASNLIKMLGKISNKIIYLLDSLGIRGIIQRYVFRLLPSKLLYRIKSSRV